MGVKKGVFGCPPKLVVDGKLECSKCQIVKPVEDFRRCAITPSGYAYECKLCKLKYEREFWAKAHPEYRAERQERKNAHMRRYLIAERAKKCAFCRSSETLNADHRNKRSIPVCSNCEEVLRYLIAVGDLA